MYVFKIYFEERVKIFIHEPPDEKLGGATWGAEERAKPKDAVPHEGAGRRAKETSLYGGGGRAPQEAGGCLCSSVRHDERCSSEAVVLFEVVQKRKCTLVTQLFFQVY